MEEQKGNDLAPERRSGDTREERLSGNSLLNNSEYCRKDIIRVELAALIIHKASTFMNKYILRV